MLFLSLLARFVFSRHPVKERIRSLNCVGRNIGGTESDAVGDIEDSAHDWSCQRKKSKVNESLFDRFRRSRGLSVTDLTGTEWCEKQMEFVLCRGRPKPTKAMQAGSARHAELEEEVIKRVKIGATTAEDRWALKFANFIIGANQLLLKGLTRELPL
ncbi:OLC1v1000401C1 [Oldenlandia corymbosa var. corymbosa]|uniref:OLC1v1000401C1 n=1 Tax=Oldenlandia corymbosa var. corymbosa TaxID=529605 RepID=A0AAV1D699_OLDCO|nr:OLC1v1000401C1 [Oldenlandia corymbosa var. corymbosa]